MEKLKRPLTFKQELFKQAYLECLNGSEAYRRVYNKDATDTVASVCAAKLLAKSSIQEAIEEARRYISGKHNITRERLIKQYANFAFPDRAALYDSNGNLKPIHELTREQSACLTGIEVDELYAGQINIGHTKKIKTVDPKGALDSLAKMLGFNEPEKIKSEVANSFPGGVLQIVIIPPIENKNEPL